MIATKNNFQIIQLINHCRFHKIIFVYFQHNIDATKLILWRFMKIHVLCSLDINNIEYSLLKKIWKMPLYTYQNRPPVKLVVGMQNGTITLEKSLKFLKTLTIHFIYNNEIPILGVYQRKIKIYVYKRKKPTRKNFYHKFV